MSAAVSRWPRASWGSLALLLLGAACVVLLLLWSGIGDALREAAAALPVLPLTIMVHAGQLFLSALAWRSLLDRAVGRGTAFRLRVVREGVDSLLPVAQVGGEILAVGLLARRGVPPALAGAGTALDLLVEGATLPVVILLGLGTLWLLGGDVRALPAVLAAAASRDRRGGRVRAGAAPRATPPDRSRRPATAGRDAGGWAAPALMARARDRRALAWAALLHVAAWSGGAAEVWLALRALGHPVGLGPAFVIESVGMAARGAGFAVPGALGVQEGGFLAGAALFGLAPEVALALSALKRVREVVVGLVGLALWRGERTGSRAAVGEAGR